MTHAQGVTAAEELLDAVTAFWEQPDWRSSSARLAKRVEQIALQMRASNVVELARHSVRVDLVEQLRDPVDGQPRRSVR